MINLSAALIFVDHGPQSTPSISPFTGIPLHLLPRLCLCSPRGHLLATRTMQTEDFKYPLSHWLLECTKFVGIIISYAPSWSMMFESMHSRNHPFASFCQHYGGDVNDRAEWYCFDITSSPQLGISWALQPTITRSILRIFWVSTNSNTDMVEVSVAKYNSQQTASRKRTGLPWGLCPGGCSTPTSNRTDFQRQDEYIITEHTS